MIGHEGIAVTAIGENPIGNVQQVPLLGAVTVIAFAPTIHTGIAIHVPAATVVVAPKVPRISISATIKPSVVHITVTLHAPAFGRTIRPHVLGAVTVIPHAPRVSAGVSLRPPRATVIITTNAPRVAAGVSLHPPVLATVGVTTKLSHISISAKIKPPVATVTIATLIPFLRAGASVRPPVAHMTVTPNVPSIRTGKRIDVPVVHVTITPRAPSIRAGARVFVPLLGSVAIAVHKPTIVAGATIIVANTIVRQLPLGGIGSESIGQYAIACGDFQSRTFVQSPTIIVNPLAPSIRAGASIRPPVVHVTITPNIPDISARSRRVAVYIIPN